MNWGQPGLHTEALNKKKKRWWAEGGLRAGRLRALAAPVRGPRFSSQHHKAADNPL